MCHNDNKLSASLRYTLRRAAMEGQCQAVRRCQMMTDYQPPLRLRPLGTPWFCEQGRWVPWPDDEARRRECHPDSWPGQVLSSSLVPNPPGVALPRTNYNRYVPSRCLSVVSPVRVPDSLLLALHLL
ncbi:unnamed protein product [Gadus morhua 'NCC']